MCVGNHKYEPKAHRAEADRHPEYAGERIVPNDSRGNDRSQRQSTQSDEPAQPYRSTSWINNRQRAGAPLGLRCVRSWRGSWGEVAELSALLATQRKEVKVTDTGATMPVTASDQIIVSGRLKSGAVASFHMRGGMSQATNTLWEVNGTEGDLLVTADDPFLHYGPLHLKIGHGTPTWPGTTTALEDVPVSEDVADVPAQLRGGPAFNVACQYALFAKDILEGTHLCADFDDAVQRHRLLEDIEKSNQLGQRVLASG